MMKQSQPEGKTIKGMKDTNRTTGGPTGLVLEGGGMRGLYTAGVLEYFAQRELYFPYQIGVSAGACMAVSYLSRQRGRNRTVNVDYAGDPRYLSWRKFLRERKELFGMDFIFGEIPNSLVPFDYQAFNEADEEFVVGTTDCETGLPVYYTKSRTDDSDILTLLRASSSLPFFAPVVEYQGRKLMDGGISDPIPVRKAQQDGYPRAVLIMTRNQGYLKSRNRFRWLLQRRYGHFPAFIDTMMHRHEIYNETVEYVEKLEREGSAFVIRPSRPISVGRVEQNRKKLEQLYQHGYEDAHNMYADLVKWMD